MELSAAAAAGSSTLEVAAVLKGVAIGAALVVACGASNEERVTVSGFGSILLSAPLAYDHAEGETVAIIAAPPTPPSPDAPPYSPDGGGDGSGDTWWVWLIVGAGGVLCCLCVGFVVARRRYQQRVIERAGRKELGLLSEMLVQAQDEPDGQAAQTLFLLKEHVQDKLMHRDDLELNLRDQVAGIYAGESRLGFGMPVEMPLLPTELGVALAFELGVEEGGEVSETQKVDLLRAYLDGQPYRSLQLQANVDALPLFVLQHAARLDGGAGGGFGGGGGGFGAGGGFGGGAEMLVVRVQIPPGGAPGTQMAVSAPDGGEHTVTIPQGKRSGNMWEVSVPPLAPTMMPPQATLSRTAALFAMSAADAAVIVEQLALLKQDLDAHLAHGGRGGSHRQLTRGASRVGGGGGGGGDGGGELPAELHPRVATAAQSLFLATRGPAAASEVEALQLLRGVLDERGAGRGGSLRADDVASLPLALLQAVGWGANAHSSTGFVGGGSGSGGVAPTATLEQLSLLRAAADGYLTAASTAAATEGTGACGVGSSRQLNFAPPPSGLALPLGTLPPLPLLPPLPPVLDAATQLFTLRRGAPPPSDHEAVVFLKAALDDCLSPPPGATLTEGAAGSGVLTPTAQFGGCGGAAGVSLNASQFSERLNIAKSGGAPLPPIASLGLTEAQQAAGQQGQAAAFGAPAEVVLARMPEPIAMALTVQFETVHGEPPAAPTELVAFARSVVDEYDDRVLQVESAGGAGMVVDGTDPFGSSPGRRSRERRWNGMRRVSRLAARLQRSGFSPRIGPAAGFETRQQSPERFEREAAQVRKGRGGGGGGGAGRGLEHLTETTTDRASPGRRLELGRGRGRGDRSGKLKPSKSAKKALKMAEALERNLLLIDDLLKLQAPMPTHHRAPPPPPPGGGGAKGRESRISRASPHHVTGCESRASPQFRGAPPPPLQARAAPPPPRPQSHSSAAPRPSPGAGSLRGELPPLPACPGPAGPPSRFSPVAPGQRPTSLDQNITPSLSRLPTQRSPPSASGAPPVLPSPRPPPPPAAHKPPPGLPPRLPPAPPPPASACAAPVQWRAPPVPPPPKRRGFDA